ncbi:MAG: hypothetical protein KBE09_01000 [Candidatus Pacebacteria bacterium]|nr:hypothetical protein [Candidatus Paceibacterota bacterium]
MTIVNQNSARNAFNAIFPTPSPADVAIFLFLLTLVMATYIPTVLSCVAEGCLALSIREETVPLADVAHMVVTLPILSLAAISFVGAIYAILLGKLSLTTQLSPTFRIHGFSYLLYIISVIGAQYSVGDVSLWLVFALPVCMYGFLFLNRFAQLHDLNPRNEYGVIRPLFVLLSTILAAGLFAYYAYLLEQHPILALANAYGTYILLSIPYRMFITPIKRGK